MANDYSRPVFAGKYNMRFPTTYKAVEWLQANGFPAATTYNIITCCNINERVTGDTIAYKRYGTPWIFADTMKEGE